MYSRVLSRISRAWACTFSFAACAHMPSIVLASTCAMSSNRFFQMVLWSLAVGVELGPAVGTPSLASWRQVLANASHSRCPCPRSRSLV